jgi:hypothetical protein
MLAAQPRTALTATVCAVAALVQVPADLLASMHSVGLRSSHKQHAPQTPCDAWLPQTCCVLLQQAYPQTNTHNCVFTKSRDTAGT